MSADDAAAASHPDPREVWKDLWRRLEAGVASARHPWHTGVLGTAGDDGFPDQRTVVLRAVDPQQHRLLFHTDSRSPKLAALAANARASWLFYDTTERVQLRIACRAEVHRDGPLVDERWTASRPSSRLCYVHPAGPGTRLPSAHAYGPPGRVPEEELESVTADGRRHFAVVTTVAQRIDWLHLDHRGHRRLRFHVTPLGFDAHWIAP